MALCATTLAVFLPVVRYDFVEYDDPGYITSNPYVTGGLSAANVRAAFLESHGGSWHPLAFVSHMVDVELFGMRSGAHHGVSLFLHVLNTVLFFLLLWRMTGRPVPSGFVAALFAIHPLHVEAVAWVSSRKDVLSALFGFLATFAYVEYARTHKARHYLLTLFLFGLALLTKPMAVTFPLTLLLLDLWPLKRFEREGVTWRRLLLDKIPFLALSALVSGITILVVSSWDAIPTAEAYPLLERMANVPVTYCLYLMQAVWPMNLSPHYPRNPGGPSVVALAAALGALLLITLFVLRVIRSHPCLAVGWFWFLITLLPVSGILPFGSHVMADRYTYIGHIGLFLAGVWGVAELPKRWRIQGGRVVAAGVLLMVALGTLSSRQVSHWKDTVTLFRHACETVEADWKIHILLARGLQKKTLYDEAIRHYRRGIEMNPSRAESYQDLASAYWDTGDIERTREYLLQATRLEPDNPEFLFQLAGAQWTLGETEKALSLCERGLELEPNRVEAYRLLAQIHGDRGDGLKVQETYRAGLRHNPAEVDFIVRLGNSLARQGHYEKAIAEYRAAFDMGVENALVYYNLAKAEQATGDIPSARQHAEMALRLAPNLQPARTLLQTLDAGAHDTP